MEIPDTYIDLIERYLAREMTEAERAGFEVRLQNETDLADALSDYQQAREAIDLFAEQRLKEQFRKQYLAERPQAREAVVKPLGRQRWLYAVAAAVVLLVAIFVGNRLLNPSMNTEALYAQYYALPPLNVRSDSEDPLEVIGRQMDQGAFAEAANALQALLADSSFSRRPAAWLRMGLCYMELQNWPIAADALEQVDAGSPLIHQARWFAALTALRRGQTEEAKSLLEQVLSESRDTELKQNAQELLDAL